MADGVIPPQDILRVILDYDPETGDLHHKARPAELFLSEGAGKAWNKKYAGKNAVSRVDHEGYHKVCLFGSRCRAHRVIWKLVYGEEPKFIDHINGDPADNRLGNLRNVEFVENCRNRKLPSNNTSGVVGVHWSLSIGRWIARIGSGRGNQRLIGTYASFDDAVAARRKAEADLGYAERHGMAA